MSEVVTVTTFCQQKVFVQEYRWGCLTCPKHVNTISWPQGTETECIKMTLFAQLGKTGYGKRFCRHLHWVEDAVLGTSLVYEPERCRHC